VFAVEDVQFKFFDGGGHAGRAFNKYKNVKDTVKTPKSTNMK
jgi:hypothetical protein